MAQPNRTPRPDCRDQYILDEELIDRAKRLARRIDRRTHELIENKSYPCVPTDPDPTDEMPALQSSPENGAEESRRGG
jgi:hypothetical protein